MKTIPADAKAGPSARHRARIRRRSSRGSGLSLNLSLGFHGNHLRRHHNPLGSLTKFPQPPVPGTHHQRARRTQHLFRPDGRRHPGWGAGYTVRYVSQVLNQGQCAVRTRLPMRVFILNGPSTGSRVVIDVAHHW